MVFQSNGWQPDAVSATGVRHRSGVGVRGLLGGSRRVGGLGV